MALPNVHNIEKLDNAKDSETVFKRALSDLKLKKDYWKTYLVMTVICAIPAIGIGTSKTTVSLSHTIASDLMGVFLALFGIVFTGYAFFQALINDQMLVMMINTNAKIHGEDGSKLQETNERFVELMMQYMMGILVSLLVKATLSFVPESFVMFPWWWLNNILAGIALFAYFFLSALVLWRMISFLFNVFQLFNLHAATRALEMVKKEKNNEE